MRTINTTPAPNLPLPEREYNEGYQNSFLNVLRLFFNMVANALGTLLGRQGGQYINNTYGAFQNNADIVLAAANTAELMPTPIVDYANGMTYSSGSGVLVEVDGIYNVQFSVQFANTDTAIHPAVIWLRKNSVDVLGTASKFDVPSKHGASDGYLIGACNFYVELAAGDTIALWWASASVATYLEAYPAQTTPYAHPTIPSAVITVTFVSSY